MRAGLVSLFAWCLMRAYTARFLKMFLGVTPDLSIYNFLF